MNLLNILHYTISLFYNQGNYFYLTFSKLFKLDNAVDLVESMPPFINMLEDPDIFVGLPINYFYLNLRAIEFRF